LGYFRARGLVRGAFGREFSSRPGHPDCKVAGEREREHLTWRRLARSCAVRSTQRKHREQFTCATFPSVAAATRGVPIVCCREGPADTLAEATVGLRANSLSVLV